jgi:L-2-hydroxycarboxylate dehydrogenase (NAD+)
MSKLLFRAADLEEYIVRFFTRHEVPEEDARIAAEILTSADLRGVSSHGIIRLDTYYGSFIRRGLIDPKSPLTVVNETAATLALDGGNGLGHVIGYRAMERCIDKAGQSGACMVTARNSNHYGIAGYYAMMALPHDMIGISYTNAQPLVAPTYGRTGRLGTNPIAVAAPADKQRPYVLDMATSIVPIGRVTVHQKAGQPIPEGWGVGEDGLVTANPDAVLKGGALMPLGATDVMRGYKGYGLGLMVDIFAGVLAGAAFGERVGRTNRTGPANVGHYFAAVRIDAFRPVDEFKRDLDTLIADLKEAPKAAGQDRIYVHGEKEFELAERYRVEGVPLMIDVVRQLQESGEEAGVPFDLEPLGEVGQGGLVD